MIYIDIVLMHRKIDILIANEALSVLCIIKSLQEFIPLLSI